MPKKLQRYSDAERRNAFMHRANVLFESMPFYLQFAADTQEDSGLEAREVQDFNGDTDDI